MAINFAFSFFAKNAICIIEGMIKFKEDFIMKYIKQIGIAFLIILTFMNMWLVIKETISCYHYCAFYSRVPERLMEIENHILMSILLIGVIVVIITICIYTIIRYLKTIYDKYYK